MAKPKRVIVYADADGNEPFTDWLYGLRDIMGRKRIFARVARLEQGSHIPPAKPGAWKAMGRSKRLEPTVPQGEMVGTIRPCPPYKNQLFYVRLQEH